MGGTRVAGVDAGVDAGGLISTPMPHAPPHRSVRNDISRNDGKSLDLFVCGDQIKKGAALNAVQVGAGRLAEQDAEQRSGRKGVLSVQGAQHGRGLRRTCLLFSPPVLSLRPADSRAAAEEVRRPDLNGLVLYLAIQPARNYRPLLPS